MSHFAKDWLASLDTRDLKGSEFKILFFLCEHHNAGKPNDVACYPSQSLLRDKTGLSNGALNNALNGLERAGHIERVRSTIPGSSTRRTYYLLKLTNDQMEACQQDASSMPLEVALGQTPTIGDEPNSNSLEIASKQTPQMEQANSIPSERNQ
ncbi:helix-turn-helix domain-containing protein [Ruegeria arenilitoris]|uniref:helix-turn-helix domain-containing protein n=1 Tax=Ruegeria arenilitoris TaxID=1173585 RepID=UPI00346400B2